MWHFILTSGLNFPTLYSTPFDLHFSYHLKSFTDHNLPCHKRLAISPGRPFIYFALLLTFLYLIVSNTFPVRKEASAHRVYAGAKEEVRRRHEATRHAA